VAIINGSYMFQLQSSHQQAVYVRITKGKHRSRGARHQKY